MKKLILILLLLSTTVFAGELTTSIGTTTSLAPGCQNDTQITKLDIGYGWNKKLSDKWSYDKEVYSPSYISENAVYSGVGGKLRLRYAFTENLSVFGGIGSAYVYNAQILDGLESDVINNAELGLKYKCFFLKYDHDSALWVRGDGVNFLFAGFNLEF